MRLYIYKLLITVAVIYVLFELTIGAKLNKIENTVYQLTDSQNREKIKNKILIEMEKANNKEQILDENEKKIISNFIEKIQSELRTKSN